MNAATDAMREAYRSAWHAAWDAGTIADDAASDCPPLTAKAHDAALLAAIDASGLVPLAKLGLWAVSIRPIDNDMVHEKAEELGILSEGDDTPGFALARALLSPLSTRETPEQAADMERGE